MKKLIQKTIGLVMLVTVSNSVMAKWIYITRAKDTSFYIDMVTIKKNGDVVKVWMLSDYNQINNNALSMVGLKELNCKDNLVRTLYLTKYSENMGKGDVLEGSKGIDSKVVWQPIIPDSIGEALSDYACGKRKNTESALSDSSLNKWTLIYEDDKNKSYTDFSLLKTNYNNTNNYIVKAWMMNDLITPATDQGVRFLSYKSKLELNCKEAYYRYAEEAYFNGNMGYGDVLSESRNGPEWIPIIPDSIMDQYKNKICPEVKN